jgi:hypothetical protein
MPIVVVGALLGGVVLAIFSQGIHSLCRELANAGSACMPQSWRLPCPQMSESTNRSHAGPFKSRPMAGRLFAPVGFDFTLSALFFYFED